MPETDSMVRTTFTLPAESLAFLDRRTERWGMSRSFQLRQAVQLYINSRQADPEAPEDDSAAS